jgi:hypothetical protein
VIRQSVGIAAATIILMVPLAAFVVVWSVSSLSVRRTVAATLAVSAVLVLAAAWGLGAF